MAKDKWFELTFDETQPTPVLSTEAWSDQTRLVQIDRQSGNCCGCCGCFANCGWQDWRGLDGEVRRGNRMTFVLGLVGFVGAIVVIVGSVLVVLSLDSFGDALEPASGESASGL